MGREASTESAREGISGVFDIGMMGHARRLRRRYRQSILACLGAGEAGEVYGAFLRANGAGFTAIRACYEYCQTHHLPRLGYFPALCSSRRRSKT